MPSGTAPAESPATPTHRSSPLAPTRVSAAYSRVQRLFEERECVILDGGVGTELERVGPAGYRNPDEGLWGTAALYEAPYSVLQVHQAYVAAGCDVISTDTWGILSAPEMEAEAWR